MATPGPSSFPGQSLPPSRSAAPCGTRPPAWSLGTVITKARLVNSGAEVTSVVSVLAAVPALERALGEAEDLVPGVDGGETATTRREEWIMYSRKHEYKCTCGEKSPPYMVPPTKGRGRRGARAPPTEDVRA